MARARLSLLLLLLVAAVYAGSLSNGFHLDDFHSIVNNPHIRQLADVPTFFRDAGTFSVNPKSAMYRPLLLTTFALDHALFGGRAAGYHAVSILLHGLTAIMALWWLLGLGVQSRVAVLTALLFAVHPINSEAVCYISSRSEVLMALFVLSALLLHALYRRRAGAHLVLLSVVLVAAGLLSKSVAIVAPAGAVAADAFRGGWQRLRSGWTVYLLLGVPCLIYLLSIRGAAARALLDAPVRSSAAQLWTQGKAQVYYLQLVVMPTHLNVEHQFDVARTAQLPALLALLLLASLAGIAWGLRRRLRCLVLGVGWWALVLLPTTVIPLIVLVNEHRLYLASIGLLLPTAWCLQHVTRRLPGRMSMATLGAGLYTIVLAFLTMQRVPDWQDEVSLWRDAVAKAPLMVRPHLRLADGLAARGEVLAAEASYLRAIELRPAHVASRNNLGLFYRRQRRLAEAEAQFRALLTTSPDNVPGRMNLATVDLMRGSWAQAYANYDTVLMYDDTDGQAQIRMGQIALQFKADARLALTHFDAAILAGAGLDADVHVGRGVALRALGQQNKAVVAYLAAADISPERSDVWYNLGNLHNGRGHRVAALAAFRRVVDLAEDDQLVRSARQQIQIISSAARTTTENDN